MIRPPAGRIVTLFVVLSLALGGVVLRLGWLQFRDADAYAARGLEQRVKTVVLPADRGRILDRTGSPLAISLDAQDVYADPTLVVDPVAEAAVLAPVLELEAPRVQESLEADGTFAWIARQVDLETTQQVADLHLAGIGFLPSTRRDYPAGSIAAQILGFVGIDGHGLSGLERQYEQELAGRPGGRRVETSPRGQEIPGSAQILLPPVTGGDLVTTIDREIQYRAEAALARAVKANGAKGGTIIVMDPRTGDVFAMASYPSFDPNRFTDFDSERFRNRAVTDIWEPGSVNKVITAAAAIETGIVDLGERFRVPATRRVQGFTIHDSHPHPIERLTLGDIIAQSSNIGASLVGDRVGSANLVQFFARFGYGRPTGIGFPGEAGGVVPTLDEWTAVTRATVSFGQGVSVTPLQMASVYATVANGGEWVRPRLVRGWRDPEGRFVPAPSSGTRRAIRPETADLLTRMLAFVVQDGTGENARIPGYQVAGKTGTAKKLDRRGEYTDRYVASFIGFLPASDPRVVVAAIIDEPDTIYGGVAAAPAFREVAQYAIQRLGIAPAPPVPQPPHGRPSR